MAWERRRKRRASRTRERGIEMPDFRRALRSGSPILFDGAMGTELYARGVFINRCYDELSRSEPELVREVHRAYRRAGAEVLETNTFGANRFQLQSYGLEGEVEEINRSSAALAREVAGDERFVAGSLGPLGVRLEPYGPTSREEARAAFREQAAALAAAGVDLFVCETFSDLSEVTEAVRGCREAADLPVLAQMTVQPSGETSYGDDPATVARTLAETGVDAVGLNCSVGPAMLVEAVREMAAVTELPVSAMPNAGLPKEVQGRKIYMASPDYMASYVRKLVEAGARIVGGCCGTSPEHVRQMAEQLRAMRPETEVEVARRAPDAEREPPPEPVPLGDRSPLGARLSRGEEVLAAALPPPKGSDARDFLEGGRRLGEAGVHAVTVVDAPRTSLRMSVLAAATLLQREAGVEAVAQYTCRDRNLLGMGSDLLGADAVGIRNLHLVTGDPPKTGPYAESTAVFDVDAIGLTNLVARLNRGEDVGGNPLGSRTAFVVGVDVAPAAADREREMRRWYWKVDAGADFAFTRPVFDLERLESFLEWIGREGTRVPVVATIWPLTGLRDVEVASNEMPGVSVPAGLLRRMRAADERGPEAAREEGLRAAAELFAGARRLAEGVQVAAPSGRLDDLLALLERAPG